MDVDQSLDGTLRAHHLDDARNGLRDLGMNPFGYHLTSVLFHTVNAVFFYFVALALLRFAFRDRSREIQARIPIGALFAALVFALHPLRVESVAWVTERQRALRSGCGPVSPSIDRG